MVAAVTPAVLLIPSTAGAAVASPAPWPPYCAGSPPALAPPLDDGTLFNPDDHSDLLLGTPGLPDEAAHGASASSSIAAGSGWHEFQMTVSLPAESVNSDLADSPHAVKWIVFVSSGQGKGNPGDPPVGDAQYFDGSAWSDLGQWDGASTKLVTTPFDVGNSSQAATATLRLRFKIDDGAPPGPAYVVEFGTYVDAEQACTHYTFDADKITVLAPGSAAGSSRSLRYAGLGAVVVAAAFALVLAARRRQRS